MPSTKHPGAPRRQPLPQATDNPHLPVDLAAFYHTQSPVYIQYAELLLADSRLAQQAVDLTLLDLARHWPRLLCAPNPLHEAWTLLTGHIGALFVHPRTTTSPDPLTAAALRITALLGEGLFSDHADTAVLYYAAGLTEAEIASTLGSTTDQVQKLLETVNRRLLAW